MSSTESAPTEPLGGAPGENEGRSWGRGRCRHGRRRFFLIPFFIAAFVLVKSAITMFLWNELVPELFHGPTLTYLQAVELVVLVKVLVGFGGRGPMGRYRFGPGGRFGHGPFPNMSPEQREKLRRHLHEHHHGAQRDD